MLDASPTVKYSLHFKFSEAPKILELDPSFGSELGGSSVSIFGDGFEQSSLWFCRFGQSDATQATLVQATFIRCVVPPGVPGYTIVSVSANKQEWYTATHAFEHVSAASLASLSPVAGWPGSLVTIRGTSFFKNITCVFGEKAVKKQVS